MDRIAGLRERPVDRGMEIAIVIWIAGTWFIGWECFWLQEPKT